MNKRGKLIVIINATMLGIKFATAKLMAKTTAQTAIKS